MRNLLIVALMTASAFANRVAIDTLEKQKLAGKSSYEQAQQAENQIFREWAQSHPGFIIDPNDFSVITLPQKQEQKSTPPPAPKVVPPPAK